MVGPASLQSIQIHVPYICSPANTIGPTHPRWAKRQRIRFEAQSIKPCRAWAMGHQTPSLAWPLELGHARHGPVHAGSADPWAAWRPSPIPNSNCHLICKVKIVPCTSLGIKIPWAILLFKFVICCGKSVALVPYWLWIKKKYDLYGMKFSLLYKVPFKGQNHAAQNSPYSLQATSQRSKRIILHTRESGD